MEEHLERSNSSDDVIKHWLLNTAVEFGVPRTCILRPVSQGLNVRPIPGCSHDDYARGLAEIFDSGLITFSSELREDEVTLGQAFLEFWIDTSHCPTTIRERGIFVRAIPLR